MTVTMTRDRVAPQPVRRFGRPATLVLHLLPVAATFAAASTLGPLLRALELSPRFALTLAVVVVLIPIELVLLLHPGHRSLWAVLSQRRPLPVRLYLLLLSLSAIGFGLVMLLDPMAWGPPADGGTLVAALLVALIVHGLVEEPS